MQCRCASEGSSFVVLRCGDNTVDHAALSTTLQCRKHFARFFEGAYARSH